MEKIIFEHVPERALAQEEVTVEVEEPKLISARLEEIDYCHVDMYNKLFGFGKTYPINLPAGMTQEEIKKIWEEKRAGKQNLERYFLFRLSTYHPELSFGRYVPENKLSIEAILGDYKAFFAGNVKMQELKSQGKLTEQDLAHFMTTTHSILGLNVVVELSDGLLYGARSQFVTQGKGMLLPIAGGFMPDHMPEESRYKNPNPFISAQKQLASEAGINVGLDELVYLGIARDTAGSENPSLMFGLDLSEKYDSASFMEMQKTAPDRHEHKDWFTIATGDELYTLFKGEKRFISSKKTNLIHPVSPPITDDTTSRAMYGPADGMGEPVKFMLVGLAGAALYLKHKQGNMAFYKGIAKLHYNCDVHFCQNQ